MTDDINVSMNLWVNATEWSIEVAPDETLLHTLRERLHLTGTKEGCSEGECGACTVLIDGAPADSCLLATAALEGRHVRTVEGLSVGDTLSALQRQFVAKGAIQCGFCTPGFLMTLTALLDENPTPLRSEVKDAISGNICRCTGYRQIVDAVIATFGDEEAT